MIKKILDSFRTRRGIIVLIIIVVALYPGYRLLNEVLFRIKTSLRGVELSLIDSRFKFRGTTTPKDSIIILEIDNSSIDKLATWPWPRAYYAQVIDILNQHGAKVIAFDIMFDSKSSLGEEQDQIFSEALKKHSNVILASKRFQKKNNKFDITTWSIPIGELRQFCDYGFVNELLDLDNSVRKSILFFSENEAENNFSWDLHILSKYLDVPMEQIKKSSDGKSVIFGNKIIPMQTTHGTLKINYAGPDHTFINIPFYQVLEERYNNMDIFKDKIVLIGATDPVLHDFFRTPFKTMSGVEVHANTIRTILGEIYLFDANPQVNAVLTILLVGLILLASYKTKAATGFLITVGILGAYSIWVMVAFLSMNTIYLWIYPIVLGLITYFAVIMARFIKEEKEKRMIKGVFQQYVSPTVVEEILKDPTKLKLGGEKRVLTVFFSDIRSFTTYSETHTPEQVVEVLNEYLDAMTKVIFKWKGTLDKYVGDEIMAVWGAPLAQPDHAELAVKCCWEQLKVSRELQAKWKSEGKDPVDFGMGLNTGEMITGNIGSSIHKDYTVIGDAVNLGARLEAETRHYGTPEDKCYLIISEFTYELVKDIVEVKPLGAVKVKGKNKPVDIYEVRAVKGIDFTLTPKEISP